MNPENGHSDLASGNLHIFKSCSSHLPPPGPQVRTDKYSKSANIYCASRGTGPSSSPRRTVENTKMNKHSPKGRSTRKLPKEEQGKCHTKEFTSGERKVLQEHRGGSSSQLRGSEKTE